jgi:hypothetical protein
VTHKYLLDVCVFLQGLGDWAYLLVRQHVLDEVQVPQRKQLEEVGKRLPADLVIVDIDVAEFLLVLEDLNELPRPIVVNIII